MKLAVPLSVRSVVSWLPKGRQSTVEALRTGRVEEETAAELDYRELPVAAISAPEMAVLAAQQAVTEAGVPAEAVGLLLHAWIHHQGHDLWSPAHYIANEIGASRAAPVGVQQVCNGGVAAVELAVARLAADPSVGTAVVTTADRFVEPGFDRWRSDYGIAYGDGATALTLAPAETGPGVLELHAVTTSAAPALERMHRGDDPFSPAARWHSPAVDMRRTKKAYLRDNGLAAFVDAGREKVRTVVETCLRDAGLAPDDPRLRVVMLPRLGRKVLEQAYVPPLVELTTARVELPGRSTGHLGAGDAIASLADLARTDLLAPGEYALVLNAGAGFTWGCLLVRRP